MDWITAVQQAKTEAVACVLVSITEVVGSAPRGVGARMVVTDDNQFDTIGGGNLEHTAVAHARAMLKADSQTARNSAHQHSLGKELSQCCGGRVGLQYDLIPACQIRLLVFGAGHVASALAKIVSELPWHVTFFDSRESWLKEIDEQHSSAGVVKTQSLPTNTFAAVEQCPDNAHYLIMTHDHAVDYELVEAILTRGDSRYCGLIASRSKAASFKSRLKRKGFSDEELDQLTAPIGKATVTGNLPMEVAIAAVADIVSLSQQAQSRRGMLHNEASVTGSNKQV